MNDNLIDFQIHGVTGYTVMSNYHLQDRNLSIKAKGLLSLMLSLPKDWDYSINGLVTLSKDGRSSVRNTLDETRKDILNTNIMFIIYHILNGLK